MGIQIMNHYYANTRTAVAETDIASLGMVCKVATEGENRSLEPLGDSDDALVLPGNYAVVMKYSTDPFAVDDSDANEAKIGSRVLAIKDGDLCVEVQSGAIIRYSVDLLDASLDPGNGGATPAIGDALGISGGKWATITAATSAGIATPVVARVHNVIGTDVVVHLL